MVALYQYLAVLRFVILSYFYICYSLSIFYLIHSPASVHFVVLKILVCELARFLFSFGEVEGMQGGGG